MNRARFEAALRAGAAAERPDQSLVNDLVTFLREMDEACCALTESKKRIRVRRTDALVWQVECIRPRLAHETGRPAQLLFAITGSSDGYPVQIACPGFASDPIADSGSLGVAIEQILALRSTATLIRMA